jgi:DNA-binding HxlR family transcriptional regulator
MLRGVLGERCRYTDLRNGLPGIATNLLADRLRDLEHAGIIYRQDAPPPIATTVFGLTERGRALKPVLRELALWGAPLVGEAPEDDAFRGYWLALFAEIYLTDHAPEQPPVQIELQIGSEPTILETVDGTVRVRRGSVEHPDLVLSGPPKVVAGLLSGRVDLTEARADGLKCEGSVKALRRVLSRGPAALDPHEAATARA